MTVLHHLAQAAAVILLIELLVLLILFLAVAGGLAFGLHWVRGKSEWAFDKANGYLPLVTKYERVVTDLLAKPFILGGGIGARLRVTLASMRRQVRAGREEPDEEESPIVASRPIEPEMTIEIPAVSDTTTVMPAVPETARRS